MIKIKFIIKNIVISICLLLCFLFYGCTDINEKCEHSETTINVIKKATCETDGFEQTKCTICNKIIKSETIKALGHDIIKHEKKESTSSEVGYEEYDTCSRCDYSTFKYIYFGEYPQSIKDESVTIISTTPNSDGYFIGSDNEKYVKVEACPYGNNYYFSNNEEVIDNFIYYFKVEPIKWEVLEENNGTYKLVTNLIIDAKEYFVAPSEEIENENTIRMIKDGVIEFVNEEEESDYLNLGWNRLDDNNYEYSNLRLWLNNDFYNTAFTPILQSYIDESEIDNSLLSTGYVQDQHVCNNTRDKVSVLSYSEVTNSSYGYINNLTRRKQLTDYAIVKGCSMNTLKNYYNNGFYWLRSPSGINSARYISSGGDIYNCWTNNTYVGVSPLIIITIE